MVGQLEQELPTGWPTGHGTASWLPTGLVTGDRNGQPVGRRGGRVGTGPAGWCRGSLLVAQLRNGRGQSRRWLRNRRPERLTGCPTGWPTGYRNRQLVT